MAQPGPGPPSSTLSTHRGTIWCKTLVPNSTFFIRSSPQVWYGGWCCLCGKSKNWSAPWCMLIQHFFTCIGMTWLLLISLSFPRIAVHTISSQFLRASPSVWSSKVIHNIAYYFNSNYFVMCISKIVIFFLNAAYSSVRYYACL